MSRTDRMAKYNQLLRIEEELGESAVFAGYRFNNKKIEHSSLKIELRCQDSRMKRQFGFQVV